ncbi:MAG: glycosyltransferase family 2 protein [Candidatus Thorarchaeota archaeon]
MQTVVFPQWTWEKCIRMNSFISVIIPVYNAEETIFRCLKSLTDQTYKNFEVIVVDDGSTDNGLLVATGFHNCFGGFGLLSAPGHCGPSVARNIGIDHASGEYIFFLDADDWLEPNALESLLKIYHEEDTDLVIGDFFKIIKEKKRESGNCRTYTKDTKLLLSDLIIYIKKYLSEPNKYPLLTQSWGKLFKASIIRTNNLRFNPELRTFEDVSFNCEYLKYIKTLYYINLPLYNHQVGSGYLSATMKIEGRPSSLFGFIYALYSMEAFLYLRFPQIDFRYFLNEAFVRYTIIQSIRLCGQISIFNYMDIYKFIKKVINAKQFKEGLKIYKPKKEDSKLIPLLMKWKFIPLVLLLCWYRSKKRYARV